MFIVKGTGVCAHFLNIIVLSRRQFRTRELYMIVLFHITFLIFLMRVSQSKEAKY